MVTRIFLDEHYREEEEGVNKLITFDSSEIRKKYNVFGFFRKNETFNDNLKEYREDRNEAFEEFKELKEDYTLGEVKSFLESFISDYEYYPENLPSEYGRPEKFIEFTDYEDCYVELDELTNFHDEKGRIIDEVDINVVIEVTEFYDGSNVREIVLTSDDWDTFYREVTEDYPNWDSMTEIYSKEVNQGRIEVYEYDHEGEKEYFEKNISYWQGSSPYYVKISEDEVEEYLNS